MSPSLSATPGTILIVEDDPAVLKVVSDILKRAGFTVLPASRAFEAADFVHNFTGIIPPLLSDVDMPGIAGPDLATRLKAIRPEMRVTLMSGHADGAVLILNYGWHFILKPVLPETLVTAVKDVLAGASRDQDTDQFNPPAVKEF